MDYKLVGLKYYLEQNYEDELSFSLEDSVGIVNPGMEDSYIIDIYYKDVFYEKELYLEDNIDDVINAFCKEVDSRLCNALPNQEEFKDYKLIEGYWECMGLARELCKETLAELWKNEMEENIEKCQNIIEKIAKCQPAFTNDELSMIENLTKYELHSINEKMTKFQDPSK